MKYIILLPLLIITLSCNLYKNSSKIKKDTKIQLYANTITAEELEQHLSVIASDEYEGRETGKKGQVMTAEYLKNEFIKDGVAPGNKGSYLQKFSLFETQPPQAHFFINKEKYSFSKDFYFFQDYSNFKTFTIHTKEIVSIENGIVNNERDDYKGKKVENKTVIINIENPENIKFDWKQKLKIAKQKGVKQVIFSSSNFKKNIERLDHFLNKSSMKLASYSDNYLNSDEPKLIPFYFFSDSLINIVKNSKSDSLKFQYNKILKHIESSNVLGFIEGSDSKLKEEIIIITAHYDHLGIIDGEIYNGADDDGTGTVALLELAEAFQKAKDEGNGTKRSILVMPVSGEEKGLLGSKYYSENPVYPIANTVVDFNIDMIGRIDENHNTANYVYLIGADKISEELNEISENVNKTYTKLELDYTFNDENDPNRFYYRSDHYNFAKKGIPVIFYFSGVHEDYHKATDEIDKIMFDKVEHITKLVFYTAWEVANRPTRLKIIKN